MVVVSRLVESVAMIPGIRVLHVDSGISTNRTVLTFAGEPAVVLRAGLALYAAAVELIDMEQHHGAHPRLGAVDVFPFVPLAGATMTDCVELAHELGKLVWERFQIPVYFYEHAAKQPERKSLVDVRRGEYEGLPERSLQPSWRPDCGEPLINKRSGATIIGARDFLVAYNVGLNSTSSVIAKSIAAKIRESGRVELQADGSRKHIPGLFKHCRAIGWHVPELGGAQVSVNFTDFTQTGLYPVYVACLEEARARGTTIKGSELIGLIPKRALLDVATCLMPQTPDHHQRESDLNSQNERQQLEAAVDALKLAAIKPFSLEERVLEYRLSYSSLANFSVDQLLQEFSEPRPTPGGGSAAAMAGMLAASLISKILQISERQAKDPVCRELQHLNDRSWQALLKFRFLADEDARVYRDLIRVRREVRAVGDADKEVATLFNAVLSSAQRAAQRTLCAMVELASETVKLLEAVEKHAPENLVPDLKAANALLYSTQQAAQAILGDYC